MADANYKDGDGLVADFTNDAIVTDSVSPELAQRAGQGFPQTARIGLRGDSDVQKVCDSAGNGLIQPL